MEDFQLMIFHIQMSSILNRELLEQNLKQEI